METAFSSDSLGELDAVRYSCGSQKEKKKNNEKRKRKTENEKNCQLTTLVTYRFTYAYYTCSKSGFW